MQRSRLIELHPYDPGSVRRGDPDIVICVWCAEARLSSNLMTVFNQ